MSDIREESAAALAEATEGRSIHAFARAAVPVPLNRRSTLRARMDDALYRADPDALYKLAQRDPTLVVRILATLQPREISATVRHEAVAVVMYPCEPPPDWVPPPLAGEVLPVIDVPNDEETPTNVGENEG